MERNRPRRRAPIDPDSESASHKRTYRRLIMLVAVLLAVQLFAGSSLPQRLGLPAPLCSLPEARATSMPRPRPDPTTALTRFAGCEELRDGLLTTAERLRSVYHGGADFHDGVLSGCGCSGLMPTAGAPMAAAPAEVAHTRTNRQEQGVDEADRIKIDASGHTWVAGRDSAIHAVELGAQGALTRVTSVALPATAIELYHDGARNQLLVFSGHPWRPPPLDAHTPPSDTFPWPPRRFHLSRIDIREPAAPEVLEEITFEGGYLTSRRMADRLVLFGMFTPEPLRPAVSQLWQQTWVDPGLADEATAAVIAAPATALVPSVTPATGTARPLVRCGESRAAGGMPAPTLSYVASIDLASGDILEPADSQTVPDATGIWSASDIVYAARRHVVLADTPGPASWWRPDATDLHLFAVTGAAYLDSAAVPGRVTSRFNLDLHEPTGILRATTWRGQWTTGVHLLELSNEKLTPRGSAMGIAPGEELKAVRYVDDMAYLVTFRQTDPLFAVDLADPDTPQVLGELWIPGFSTYLHPVTGDRLLTVGWAGDWWGAEDAVQVQLFDVSDPTAPWRIAYETVPGLDGQQSDAIGEARAFTYSPELGTLVLPLTGKTSEYNEPPFVGFQLFSVDVSNGMIATAGRMNQLHALYRHRCGTPPDEGTSWWNDDCFNEGSTPALMEPLRSRLLWGGGHPELLLGLSDRLLASSAVSRPARILGVIPVDDGG